MTPILSGHYAYFVDGQRKNIEEPWQLQANNYGVRLSGERIVDGHCVLAVQARYQQRQCNFMRISWQARPQDDLQNISYWQRHNILNWRFDHESESQRLELPSGSLMFPLLRAASGPLIQQLSEGERCVIVPRLHDPAAKNFLHPLLSQRRAKATSESHQWRCFGGEYGETGALYQLNALGLTQAYEWQTDQGLWQIKLDQLTQHKVIAMRDF